MSPSLILVSCLSAMRGGQRLISSVPARRRTRRFVLLLGTLWLALASVSPIARAQYAEQTGVDNPLDGVTATSTPAAVDAVAADFDTDGDVDLLAYDGSTERFFENDGSGLFTEKTSGENPFDGVSPAFGTRGRTFVRDVDGDDDLDVVSFDYTGSGSGTLGFVENTDGSTYVRRTGADNPFDGIPVSGNQASVDAVVGDFDDDGDPDLLVYDGSSEHYYENGGSGSFSEKTGSENPFDEIAQAFWTKTTTLVRDFDGDDDVDVAFRDGTGDATNWAYREQTDTGFAVRTGSDNPLNNVAADATAKSVAITTGDFDTDGHLDLLTSSGGTQHYYEGDGAGDFTERTGSANPFDSADPALQVTANTVVADLNVDGDSDLTFADDDALRYIGRTGAPAVDLRLTAVAATPERDPGEQTTVTVTLDHVSGGANATGVAVDASIPSGLLLQGASPSTGTFSGGTWTVGALAPNASATLDLAVEQDDAAPGAVSANVSALDQHDASPASAAASIVPQPYGSGSALTLDGNGDYVSMGSMDLSGSAITLEAWVKPSQFPNPIHTIAGIEAGTGLALLRIGDTGLASDKPQFVLEISGTTVRLNAATALSTGQWQHVAATYDDSTMRLYVDGRLDNTRSQSGAFTANDVFRIGRSAGGRYFFGQIDQVRIWNTALTQNQIQARARRTMDPSTAGLVASYRFDAGAGTTAFDVRSGDGTSQNGTLQGSASFQGVSDVGLGQASAVVQSGSQAVGPSDAAVTAANVSISGSDALQLYQYGRTGGPARTSSTAGEDFSQVPSVLRRYDVVWGLEPVGSATADVTFDYSGLVGDGAGVRLVVLKRAAPGQPWTDVTSQFTRNAQAQTFLASDVNTFSQYAFGLSWGLQVEGTAGEKSGDAGWRFLGVPTASSVQAQDLRLGGTAPSFNLPSGHMVQRWSDDTGAYEPMGPTDNLQPGRGYAVFLFDQAPYALDPSMVIDVAGTPSLQGNQSVTVSGLATSARWHLLANPYPSGYDLSSLTSLSGSGFQATVQRFDGADGTWDVAMQTGTDLSAWQGFFVERTAPGGVSPGASSLTFDPAGQIASAPFVGSKEQDDVPQPRATLGLALKVVTPEGDTLSRDRAAQVVFDARAEREWDPWDASKLVPLATEYALVAPEGAGRAGSPTGKAVESRPWPTERQSIPLQLTAKGVGEKEATLSIHRWTLPDGWRARIVDRTTGEAERLASGTTYTVVLPADSVRSAPRYEVQVAPTGAPLPVELAGFDAAQGEESVRLTWQTASETNNAGFWILRKGEGQKAAWTQIGFVEGAGTTSEPQTYRFTDAELPFAADSLTYRLKQIDTGGTAHVSDAITVRRAHPKQVRLLGSVPNPARSQATIRYTLPKGLRSQEVRLEVYDLLGRRVMTLVKDRQNAGRKQATLDVSRLASGTYVYRLLAGETTKSRKLTVVH